MNKSSAFDQGVADGMEKQASRGARAMEVALGVARGMAPAMTSGAITGAIVSAMRGGDDKPGAAVRGAVTGAVVGGLVGTFGAGMKAQNAEHFVELQKSIGAISGGASALYRKRPAQMPIQQPAPMQYEEYPA